VSSNERQRTERSDQLCVEPEACELGIKSWRKVSKLIMWKGTVMNLKVTFRGGTRFDIVGQGHAVVTDQPREDGGNDAGMSPVEALRWVTGKLRWLFRG